MRVGSTRWKKTLKAAIKTCAWQIVQVCVYAKGNRKVAYVCMQVTDKDYLCGLCGHGKVVPKVGQRCSECGARVCRVTKAFYAEMARDIERKMYNKNP